MAKKKPKRLPPTRECESCGTAYHPRAKACPKCGAVNPRFEITPAQRARESGRSDIELAIEFVEKSGGLRAARQAMETVEQIQKLPA